MKRCQYAAMLRHRARAVPPCQPQDCDTFERLGDRGVVVEIALYNFGTCRHCGRGGVAHEGASLGTGSNKGIQCRASDLSRCCSDKYHDCYSVSRFRHPEGRRPGEKA